MVQRSELFIYIGYINSPFTSRKEYNLYRMKTLFIKGEHVMRKSNCRQQSHHVRDKCLNIVAVKEERNFLIDLGKEKF